MIAFFIHCSLYALAAVMWYTIPEHGEQAFSLSLKVTVMRCIYEHC